MDKRKKDQIKNWVVFIILFILSVSLVISILVLSNAMAPIKDIEQKAEELAISSVFPFYRYRFLYL
ncbi:putative protein YpmB OS=Ureibacillus acetophenoni OX=614649 GN=SAMN05877842_103299 PE=4 SV=1 [Ureibacillus acetophenoni]